MRQHCGVRLWADRSCLTVDKAKRKEILPAGIAPVVIRVHLPRHPHRRVCNSRKFRLEHFGCAHCPGTELCVAPYSEVFQKAACATEPAEDLWKSTTAAAARRSRPASSYAATEKIVDYTYVHRVL